MSGTVAGLLLLTLTPLAWESNGPYGGFVTAAALDPENTVFVVTNQGLFEKAAASTWTDINKNLPVSGGINELEWLAERLWACTKTEGLWWTKEADPAWHRADSIPTDADVVGIVEYDGMIYAAARSEGVWTSEDGGNTFTYHNLAGNGINAVTQLTVVSEVEEYVALAINNEAVYYAGYNLGVLEFDTTIALPAGEFEISSLEFAPVDLGYWNPPHLYVGTDIGVLILKPDFTWEADVALEGSSILDLERHEGYIYAVALLNSIYRQGLDPPGQLWSFFGDGLGVPLAIGLAAGVNGFVAVAADGVYEFNNTGWSKIGNLPALGLNGMAVEQANPGEVAVSALGSGLFLSHDAGGAWQPVAADNLYLALSLSVGNGPSGTFSYAGLVIGLAFSHNWGPWTVYDFPDVYNNPTSVHRVVCNPADVEEVWFSTYSGSEDRYQVWYSPDALETPAYVIQDLGVNAVLDISYSASQGRLYVSTMLGTLWSDTPDEAGSLKQAGDANLPANALLVQLEPAVGRLFALTNHGEVFTSDDGALSWSRIEGVAGVTSIATEDSREDLLLITRLEGPGEVYADITSDTGRTWDPVSTDPLAGEAQLCRVRMINDTTGHAYVATRAGVFHEMFVLESESPQPDTLDLTITPIHRQFYPEIGEVAEFELGGETGGIVSWSVEIYDAGGYFVFGKSGEGRPPDMVPWDGYTWDGSMRGQDTYTAAFFGESETGSGDAEATVELVLGDPPRSTHVDATAGSRLLVQDASNEGFLIYRSRDPEEFFGVGYSEDDKSYYGGFPVSKSRDASTRLASAALSGDGTYWIMWMDEDPELEFPFNLYAMRYDEEPQPVLATSAKVSHAAVAVSENGYPVIAVVESSSGLNDGFIHYFDAGSWSRDAQFTEVGTQEIRDVELVPAAGGVHILYLASDTLHDVIWTAPGAALDRSHDPAIAGVAEFSAASYGDDAIHLAYAAGGLHYRGYSAGAWDGASTPIPGNTATYEDITCNVNAVGIFTVAWTWGAADLIYYIQRTAEGTWSNAEQQTPSGDAYHPQLPARTYSSDQPFIAWTDGSTPPYRVRVAQLGEAPPEDSIPALALSFKQNLSQGDTLVVTVTAGEPLDEMFVHIEGGELDMIGPSYIWPDKPTEPYDSLAAYFEDTGWWPLGDYLVVAEGAFKDTVIRVTDSLKVVPSLDSAVLISPEKVFFVPSPAVQQRYGYVYYDLNYDARITLEIFTMRGKRILQYEENGGEMVTAGYHNYIEVDISGLGSDVYVFRLIADAEGNEDFQAMREGIEGDRPPIVVPVCKPFVVVR